MSIYYNPENQNFTDTAKEDNSVLLTEAEFEKLIQGINQGLTIAIDEAGKAFNIEPAPSSFHKIKERKWYIEPQDKEKWQNQQRDDKWIEIKAFRDRNIISGVFIASVGKFFDTDEASQQRYIALKSFSELPKGIMWKTSDNSFVELTKSIVDEILTAVFVKTQTDFQNAEMHKAKLYTAENPKDYDFSTGWSESYQKGR